MYYLPCTHPTKERLGTTCCAQLDLQSRGFKPTKWRNEICGQCSSKIKLSKPYIFHNLAICSNLTKVFSLRFIPSGRFLIHVYKHWNQSTIERWVIAVDHRMEDMMTLISPMQRQGGKLLGRQPKGDYKIRLIGEFKIRRRCKGCNKGLKNWTEWRGHQMLLFWG